MHAGQEACMCMQCMECFVCCMCMGVTWTGGTLIGWLMVSAAVLCAEDTNQYGMDRRDGQGLAELLRELGKLEGLKWIRIL